MDAPAREGISTSSSGTSSNGQSSLSESTLVARQRSILHELAQLVADRAKAEPQVERVAGLGPAAESADNHVSLEAVFDECMRHPGASGFAHSSAVDKNVLVGRELRERGSQVAGFEPDGAANARSAAVIVALAADVNDQEVVSAFV